jgi:RNA polymerase sigma-70 factor, ECF subfamily
MPCYERELQASYNRLVKTGYRRVFRFLYWLCGDQALAEDLTQEAFLRAWRALPGSGPAAGAEVSWLLAIARNVYVDESRRRKLDTCPLVEARDLPSGEATLPDAVIARDAEGLLRRAVFALPEPYRAAVVLTRIEGLSTSEAARALGIPAGTVKWRVWRGVRILRSRYTMSPRTANQEECHVAIPDLSTE